MNSFCIIDRNVGMYKFYKGLDNKYYILNIDTNEIVRIYGSVLTTERKNEINRDNILFNIIDNLSITDIKFLMLIMISDELNHNNYAYAGIGGIQCDYIAKQIWINQLTNLYNFYFETNKCMPQNVSNEEYENIVSILEEEITK